MSSKPRSAAEIENSWKSDARWKGITRHYSAGDVVRLRGTRARSSTRSRAWAPNACGGSSRMARCGRSGR